MSHENPLNELDELDETTDILSLKIAQRRQSDPPRGESLADLERRLLLRMVAKHNRALRNIYIALVIVVSTFSLIFTMMHFGIVHFGH